MRNLLRSLAAILIPWLAAHGETGIESPSAIAPFLNGNLPSPNLHTGSENWELVEAFPGLYFKNPIHLTSLPATNRLLVIEHQGLVYEFENGTDAPSTKRLLLDITDRVQESNWGGLLSLVFHPGFGEAPLGSNPYVYLFYRHSPDEIPGNAGSHLDPAYVRVSRFEYDFDLDEIDSASESVLIQQYDASKHHLGGSMFFGGDGFLYISRGDEYCCNDPTDATQQITRGFFSGVLRIDVDRDPAKSHPIRRQPQDNTSGRPSGWPASFSQGYFIPNDNPWLDPAGGILEEFYAIGFRSPHSMTYDPVSGNRFVADVGESEREEIDVLEKGKNYQWPYREGEVAGPKSKPSLLIGADRAPIHAYPHSNGANCIIGGHVYRGSQNPSLAGKYVFADNGNQEVWALTYTGEGQARAEYLCTATSGSYYSGISGIGIDSAGEIYILKMWGHDDPRGRIYKLSRDEPSLPEPPALLSQTGAFLNLATLEPAAGIIPYSVNAPLYSDGARKRRWIAIPNDGAHDSPAEKIGFSETGNWTFPDGTVQIKHFELPTDEDDPSKVRRLETRFMILGTDGASFGFTYRWRADGSDADLLTASFEESIPVTRKDGSTAGHLWHYPSRTECYSCHSTALGYVLGIRTRQLNGERYYSGTERTANQLETLHHLGVLSPPIDVNRLPAMLTSTAIDDRTVSIQRRALSYLDSNCSQCHQARGTAHADFDARLNIAPAAQNIVGRVPNNTLNIPGAKIVAAGAPSKSVLYLRMNSLEGCCAMPPLAKNAIDAPAVKLIEDWINTIDESVSPPDPDLEDIVPPVPSLAGPDTAIGSFTVTAVFSEDVYGLSEGDFVVTNGVPASLSGSGANYQLIVEPASAGTVTVALPSDRVIDAGANANPPSNLLPITSQEPPVLSISGATADESSTQMEFVVLLSAAAPVAVQADYEASAGTASAPADFTPSSGTLIIPAGESSATIAVPLSDDSIDEPNESFAVRLSGAKVATLGASVAAGTIIDNDSTPVVSIANAAAGEESGRLSFSLALTNPSSRNVTVAFTTSNGTATAGADYAAKSGTVTLSPGQISLTLEITLLQDATDENSETVLVSLTGASNAAIGRSTATGLVIDDDEPPIAKLGNGQAFENAGALVLPVTLSAASAFEIRVPYTLESGTADAGLDFQAAPGSILIEPGATTASIVISLIDDAVFEGFELLKAELQNGEHVELGSNSATGVILDDESPPALQVAPATAIEAEGSLNFEISLSGASSRPVVFRCETTGETADSTDFVGEAVDFTFAAGQMEMTIAVPINDDSTDEPDETVLLTVANSENTGPDGVTGIGTIIDDDDPPAVAMGEATATESEETVRFTLTLSAPSAKPIEVSYTTEDGQAEAGADYEAATGTVEFLPGVVEQLVTIAILPDALDESDERFDLLLSSPSHASLAAERASALIIDDDDPPEISVAREVTLSESESPIRFTLSLSAPSAKPIEVSYTTEDGQAEAGADYEAATGTVEFLPGVVEQLVTIAILPDALDESDERFDLLLSSPSHASLAAERASALIIDDDDPPEISVRGGEATEGSIGLAFVVELSVASGRDIRVSYATADGSAIAGVDYEAASESITIAAGERSASILVPFLADYVAEDDESFVLRLTDSVNAFIVEGLGEAVATIKDDEDLPLLSIESVTVNEYEAIASLTVSISGASATDIEVEYQTIADSAGPEDFELLAESVIIPAGSLSATLEVTLRDDLLDEADETFQVQLTRTASAALGAIRSASVTIRDDDDPPGVSIESATGSEESEELPFRISLDAPSGLRITVNYRTAPGTAVSESDFEEFSGSVTIEPGLTDVQISIPLIDDGEEEADEHFGVLLTLATNATVAVNEATGQIIDNDKPRETKPFARAIDEAPTSLRWWHDSTSGETLLEIIIDPISGADRFAFEPEVSADLTTWEALDFEDYTVTVESQSVRTLLKVPVHAARFVRFLVTLRGE